MRDGDDRPSGSCADRYLSQDASPLIIATILPEQGITGVHTHIQQLRQYLMGTGTASALITPFSWGGLLSYLVFGIRPLVLERVSGQASVVWYRFWHEVFLRNALRRYLAVLGDCVVYAQDPLAARAALRARKGPHQRVVLAVHFQTSQADEWAHKQAIKRDSYLFKAIRKYERHLILRVDGLMYVSRSAQEGILSWLPEAAAIPCAVISNFVSPLPSEPEREPLGDLVTVGSLLPAKNHDFLLAVLAEAKRAGKSLTLDIFGEGPLRKELVQQARRLGLGEQIRLRGFQPDVRNFLPGFRAYVHASYLESQSLAIIEAMAAGLPIVAGKVGGISELCDDGVEARFWSLDDPADAAATLISLLSCEASRIEAAQAARERFQRDFDADVVAPQLLAFLGGSTPGRTPRWSEALRPAPNGATAVLRPAPQVYQDGVPADHLCRAVSAPAPTCCQVVAVGKGLQSGVGVETQIRTELVDFIVMNYLFGDISRVPRDDDTLVEDGIIDSTGILELIEFLESRFGIEVSEAEMVPQNLGSISSLMSFVMSKRFVHEPTH